MFFKKLLNMTKIKLLDCKGWKAEKNLNNYCGRCNNTPTDSQCDGTCFNISENRIHYISEILKKIQTQTEELENKE